MYDDHVLVGGLSRRPNHSIYRTGIYSAAVDCKILTDKNKYWFCAEIQKMQIAQLLNQYAKKALAKRQSVEKSAATK